MSTQSFNTRVEGQKRRKDREEGKDKEIREGMSALSLKMTQREWEKRKGREEDEADISSAFQKREIREQEEQAGVNSLTHSQAWRCLCRINSEYILSIRDATHVDLFYEIATIILSLSIMLPDAR